MFEIACKIIFCLILAALLGFIIGYLLGKRKCYEEKKQDDKNIVKYSLSDENPKNDDLEKVDEKVIHGIRPAMLKREEVTPDDLKRIKGVGPKLESTLNELGIFTFEQIASWNEDEVEWVDEYLAFKGRIKREDWRSQAKILSEGGETDFSKNYDEN